MDEMTKQQLLEMVKALSNSVSGFDAQIAAMQSAIEAAQMAQPTPTAPGEAPVPQQPASDKIYSQDDLDAAVNAAVLPLQATIGQLEGQISDLNKSTEERVQTAVEGMKAQLLADYESSQVAETAAETGFKAKLQPAQPAAGEGSGTPEATV